MKYEILKDDALGCWVVWEIHKNIRIDIYHAKTRKECRLWLTITK